MGFWFLQDPTVGVNADGKFSGDHVDGDILIQSSLTNGGGVSEIHVYKWKAVQAHRDHRFGRGRLHRRQARHDGRVRDREHVADHSSRGTFGPGRCSVLLRGWAQPHRALPRRAGPVLLVVPHEHPYVGFQQRRAEGLRQRQRSTRVARSRSRRTHSPTMRRSHSQLHARTGTAPATFQLTIPVRRDDSRSTNSSLAPITVSEAYAGRLDADEYQLHDVAPSVDNVVRRTARSTSRCGLAGTVECTYVNKRDHGFI